MAVKVGINGFGRIGRMVLRVMLERPSEFDVVAINDLSSPKALALLLQYDSVHGKLAHKVTADADGLVVGDRKIKVTSHRNPAEIPWGAMGVDVVIESTGFFTEKEGARGGFADHIKGGAKKVIISAPAKGEDITIVMKVNCDNLTKDHTFISNASCTTNCLGPLAKVLDDSFGIELGMMTTVHAYTNDQNVADQIHADPRRARAAAQNIIPSSTGAAKAIGLVLPQLKGKLDGTALRVPVVDGSITDLVAVLKKEVTVDEVNAAMKAAAEGPMLGVLEYSTDPLVSTDIIDNPHSCIFDSLSTMVSGGKSKTVKVFGWYDNEWGYSCRTADLVAKVGKML